MRLLGLNVLWLLAALPASAAPPTPGRLEPSRVGWTELRFKASKLFLTARSEITLANLPAAEAEPALITPGEGDALQPGGETVRLRLHTRFAGRGSEAELFVDPTYAGAFQRTETELSKKRRRHKCYRYTRGGVFAERRRPKDGEEDRPRRAWSDVETSFTPFPDGAGTAVTEPAALLYLVPAAALRTPGDALRVEVFSKRRVLEVDVRVEEEVTVPVDYVERSPDGERRVHREAEALRIALRPRAVDGGEDAEFKFLGLEGDVDLFLDANNRVPLQVSGRVEVVGVVRFRLEEVVLR